MNSPPSRLPHYRSTFPSHNHCWALKQLNCWQHPYIHSGIIMPLYHTVCIISAVAGCLLLYLWMDRMFQVYQAIIHMLCLYIIFWCAFSSICTYLYAVLIMESIDKRKHIRPISINIIHRADGLKCKFFECFK